MGTEFLHRVQGGLSAVVYVAELHSKYHQMPSMVCLFGSQSTCGSADSLFVPIGNPYTEREAISEIIQAT